MVCRLRGPGHGVRADVKNAAVNTSPMNQAALRHNARVPAGSQSRKAARDEVAI